MTTPSPARRRALVVTVALLTVILLAGYMVFTQIGPGASNGATNGSDSTPSASPSQAPTTDGTVQGFYSQQVTWAQCSADEVTLDVISPPSDMSPYQCATLAAPLDWDNPSGETISLRVAVYHGASGNSHGLLFYNLGGPGGAAVKSLSYQVTQNLGKDLVSNYDIAALDPRGVGESTPIVCMSDTERDAYNADDSDASDADQTPQEIVAHSEKVMRDIGAGCTKHSGDIAAHADTVSAAKDFDMVRAVLGQKTLNYLGYSYGTFLGATYAGLFPEHVGRFVLDGALDPAMSINEVSDLQMKGFEASLQHWVEDCQAGSGCPFTGGTDAGVQALAAFVDRLATSPLTTSDANRPLTQSLGLTAMIGCLYSTSSYATLTQAMQQAVSSNDGSMLLRLADYFNDRNDDGTYASSSTDALIAINSLDYPPEGTIEEWAQDAATLKSELPVLGQFSGYASAGLSAWPFARTATRQAINAKGAAPIVVVGTTHDPATPYVMAQNLAKELASGVLVTHEGWNHTAYSKSASSCITGAVENYLVDGTVPQDGLTCN